MKHQMYNIRADKQTLDDDAQVQLILPLMLHLHVDIISKLQPASHLSPYFQICWPILIEKSLFLGNSEEKVCTL